MATEGNKERRLRLKAAIVIVGLLVASLADIRSHAIDAKALPDLATQVVAVPVGGSVTVLLPRNDGTGAFWRPAGDAGSPGVSVVQEPAVTLKDDAMLVGGPSGDIFRVAGASPGRSNVVFELRRGQQPPSRLITVVFDVR